LISYYLDESAVRVPHANAMGECLLRDETEYYEMSPIGSNTDGSGFSLRNAILAVLLLLVVRLGTGWARGIVEGDYLIGIVGLALALGPIIWLLFILREAYF
jgi:hypothetical protein